MINITSYIWHHPLASKNRTLALWRFFCWQLSSRVIRRPILVPFIGQTRLVVERGMTGATGNIYCGLHEFADMAFLLHFARQSELVVDVGANVGSYSVLAAGVVGAEVLALEPLPFTFARLKRNVHCNGLENKVDARCCAAGEAAGELSFTADLDTMNRVVGSDYRGETVTVPVAPLDSLLDGKHPVMWKVDVEGFEPAVLAGAHRALADQDLHAVLLEGNQPEVVNAMLKYGFVRAVYEPFSRSLRKVVGGNGPGGNSLWIRSRSFTMVQQRCKDAASFTALSLSI